MSSPLKTVGNNLSNMGESFGQNIKSAIGLGTKNGENIKSGGYYDGAVFDEKQIGAKVWYSDFFLNYAGPDGSNYSAIMGYEFVIVDNNVRGNVIARIALPLAPQNINISIPAATNLTVTQKGILEEHNGAPLRPIQIQGTTGVLPISMAEFGKGPSGDSLSFLFKNTLNAVSGFTKDIKKTVALITGKPTPTASINYSTPDAVGAISGFKVFHNLARFFDFYLAAKKTKEGSGYRLGFNMYKDNMFYFTKLDSYTLRKQAGTLEYFYSIGLTAWRRSPKAIGGTGFIGGQGIGKSTKNSDISSLSRGIQSLKQARKTLAAASGIIKGFGNDIDQSLFIPAREVILFSKQIAGLAVTADEMFDSIGDNFKAAFEINTRRLKEQKSPVYTTMEQSANEAGFSLAESITEREGYQISDSEPVDDSGLSIEKILTDPLKSLTVLEKMDLDQMQLTPELEESIQTEKDRVAALSVEDLRKRRDTVVNFAQKVSDQVGGANATYARIKNVPYKNDVSKKMNVSDILLLQALNDTIQSMDQLIAAVDDNSTTNENDYALFYGDYARSYDINFRPPGAKIFVPFPYNATLEQLSIQYLGDADRWIEIAAINGLKAPYVDEEGFEVPFIASGSGNTVTIQSAENLYIGQVVRIKSRTQKATTRKITIIDKVDSTQTLVSFDGEANLSNFVLIDAPYVHAYLPDTVNSLKSIAIPTESAPNDINKVKLFPGIEDTKNIVRLSKVDFLLQSNGDLALTSGGDVRLAYGLTNLIQAAKLKLFTPLGSIATRPNFGNPVQVGANIADLNMNQVLKNLDSMFKSDPRFLGVNAGQALLKGNTVELNLLLGIDNANINLPIKTELPTV